jgi:hypothetical protein
MRECGGLVKLSLTLNSPSPLPKRDAILKSKNNKRMLASTLCNFNLGENATMETQDDGVFGRYEEDVTNDIVCP